MTTGFAVHVGQANPTHPHLHGRSLLTGLDVTAGEWHELLSLAGELKADKRMGREVPRLRHRNIALMLEVSSATTRSAFEVAAHDQGAHVTHLHPDSLTAGGQGPIRDTARVLGRMYDTIGYRASSHRALEELAGACGIPVWNAGTDLWQPTQALCDVLTMTEHCRKPAREISVAYLGDASSSVAGSLLVAGALLGMDVRLVSPPALRATAEVVQAVTGVAAGSGASITETADVGTGVAGVDFVCTDGWLPREEKTALWEDRVRTLSGYAVSMEVLRATGNPDVKFMHPLPALHNRDSELGQQLSEQTGRTSLEVDDEVFESPCSIVFDQAENLVHTIKAVMVATSGLLTCE